MAMTFLRSDGVAPYPAYVTDITWIGRSVCLLSWLIPGEVRVVSLRELDAAKAWVTE